MTCGFGVAMALIFGGLLLRLIWLAVRGADPDPEPEERRPPPTPIRAPERLSGERVRFERPRAFDFDNTVPPGDSPLTAERVRAAAKRLREQEPDGPPLWGDGLD